MKKERSRKIQKFLNSPAQNNLIAEISEAVLEIEEKEAKEEASRDEYLALQPNFEDL